MSLDDPFGDASDAVWAQQSGTRGNGTGTGGGSFGHYDEQRVTNSCTITWDLEIWKEEVEGTYNICVAGDEWFCNSGCYEPGGAPL